jgi:hypothetical protein
VTRIRGLVRAFALRLPLGAIYGPITGLYRSLELRFFPPCAALSFSWPVSEHKAEIRRLGGAREGGHADPIALAFMGIIAS